MFLVTNENMGLCLYMIRERDHILCPTRMNWEQHVSNSINKAKRTLHAIRLIIYLFIYLFGANKGKNVCTDDVFECIDQ